LLQKNGVLFLDKSSSSLQQKREEGKQKAHENMIPVTFAHTHIPTHPKRERKRGGGAAAVVAVATKSAYQSEWLLSFDLSRVLF
jgi:hypothetical protein